MLSAFFISNRDAMYLSDIKSSDHCTAYITVAPQYITVAPQYITVVPHPAAIAALYGTASFQYEAALSDLGTYKCGLILLASVQMSIKLILSLSLVSKNQDVCSVP